MHWDQQLWSLTRGFRGRLALAVVIGVLTSTTSLALYGLIGWLLGDVVARAPAEQLVRDGLAVLAAAVGRAVLQLVRDTISFRTAAEVQCVLRERLFAKLLELGPSEIARRRSGELAVTLSESVEQLEAFFAQYLPQLAVAAISPAVLAAFFLWIDPRLALLAVVVGVVAYVLPAAFRVWLEDVSIRRWRVYADFASELIDSVQGLATLKAFGQGRARTDDIAHRARSVFKGTMEIVAANSTSRAAIVVGTSFGGASAIALAANAVEAGELSAAALVVVVFASFDMFRPLRDLSSFFHAGLMGISATADVTKLLDTRPTVVQRAHPTEPIDASVAFERVTFAYPRRATDALTDVSFRVRPGESVGIVGPSGAGKSTVLWLLLRLYDPREGRVLVGGRDVGELSFAALRRHVAVVSQDPYLFHGTIAANLRLARPDATQAELEAAARAANAHEFIARLPHGYESLIGERGARLSGGERQRLSIARAILRDAPILLLDEALSSVDARSEELIQQALARLVRGRTTITVAHRLSSVAGCDRIFVLDRGRTVEEGTHAELLARDGTYARLMAEQARLSAHADDEEESPSPTEEAGAGLPPLPVAPPSDILGAGTGAGWISSAARLFRVIQYRVEFVLVLFLALLPIAFTLGTGVACALAFSTAAQGGDLTWPLVWLFILAPLTIVAVWADNFTSHDLAFRLLVHVRVQLFRVLERLAPAYLVRRRSGDIVGLATYDIELIEIFYAHTIGPMLSQVVPIGVVVALYIVDVRLGLALTPFVAIAAATVLIGRRRLERLAAQARERLGMLNAYTMETLQGIRDIFVFGQEAPRRRGFNEIARGYEPVRYVFNRARGTQSAVLDLTVVLGGLSVAATGAWLVSLGRIDPYLLPLYTLVAMLAFGPIGNLARTGIQLAETLAAARRLAAVHDEPVPVLDGPALVGPSRPKGLRFERVRFTYEGAARPALDDVTFTLAPGTTTALVGPSGAGKSTVAHLILRFWDPDEGRIVLDGRDLRDYQLDSLRGCVALVAQDTYLFNTTVRGNILVARPGASAAELEDAARRSGVVELAEALPDGLDTHVGERGAQLSGGQRQRISIARAFLKNAPILVLDEATSHLDAENERIIRAALADLSRDRATLVIAHRLSTVRDADAIIVLDRGRVAEVGTHDDLVRASGLYAGLVSAQVRAARQMTPA